MLNFEENRRFSCSYPKILPENDFFSIGHAPGLVKPSWSSTEKFLGGTEIEWDRFLLMNLRVGSDWIFKFQPPPINGSLNLKLVFEAPSALDSSSNLWVILFRRCRNKFEEKWWPIALLESWPWVSILITWNSKGT